MLIPIIQHQCLHPVWRMEIDSLSGIIFLETRDSENKRVTFTGIDLINHQVTFDNLATPERWLAGIETAYNGVLLIHNYLSESSPVHKGLTAIAGPNGETLWSNYTLAFDHLSVNGPVVYNAQVQPKKLFLADIKNGATLRGYEPLVDTDLDNRIKSPQMVPAQLLTGISLPVEAYGNTVHYMEHNSYRIVSLHTFLGGQLEQHLFVLDNEGGIVYRDLLAGGIQKLQPEAFVVHNNKLICLKNRSELVVLNL